MTSFRYAALALFLLAAPAALAQSLQLDYAPMAPTASPSGASLVAITDSIFYDSGDNITEFTIGFGFPGGNATPQDPGEVRASRYIPAVVYTVPASRTTPFALTGMRLRYRTSTVSGATSTPPRVQFDADAPPVFAVFPGAGPPPVALDDSTSAIGAVATGALPFSTATIISTVDSYAVPITQQFLVSFIPPGQTTVPANLVFQPGESFSIRLQFFNVPFPMQVEAGSNAAFNDRSFSLAAAGFTNLDLLTFNGLGVADTGGADTINDQWFMRAVSDDAFTTSGEDGAENRALALGSAEPNPVRGQTHIPFALREAGSATISVYDALGRRVAVVAEGTFASGGQSVDFDASRLAPGVYSVVLEAAGQRATQRMSVVR